ncbi:MAG: GIY-YIG nuclease family protein [Alphaproteobacteria bacterium]|nr:GIY-YIG nuclease family protein [Alphaproteobacteria bacterium]
MLFEGDRIAADVYLKTIAGRFYVYVLCRPDGRPFYVGKGLNRRVLEHEAEARRNHPVGEANPFKCNVIRKILRDGGEVIYRIDTIYDPAEQQACLEREALLIKTHGRLHEGGCLTNLAGGLGNLSGAAPHSLARHADTLSGEPKDNPERAILNRFLQGIGPVGSVPVKPIDQITRILPTTPHPQPRSPTPRCAYALIASASASGQQLVPGVVLPRAFSYQGVAAIIENGVSRDILKAGMASLVAASNPAGEAYMLSEANIAILSRLVGREALSERGLL